MDVQPHNPYLMKRFFTVFALLALAVPGRAQLVITSADYLSMESQANSATAHATTDVTGLATILATSGQTKTWDFSHLTWTISPQTATGTVVAYPGGAPFASDPDFTSATNVVISTPTDHTQPTIYDFVKFDGTGLWDLGMSQDSAGVTSKLMGYSPGQQNYAFPLQYQTTWQSTSTVHADYLPPGASMTITKNAVVDGDGTIIIPPSKSSPTLRIRTENMQAISIFGFAQTIRVYSFEWVTKSGIGAGVSADSNQKPQTATYSEAAGGASVANGLRDFASDPLTLRLSANPASNTETKLSFEMPTEGTARVALMDMLGNNVHDLLNGHAAAGSLIIPIDPTTLASGTYFIRVDADGMTATRKLVITR